MGFKAILDKIYSIKQELWLSTYKKNSRIAIRKYVTTHQGAIRVNIGSGGSSLMKGWINGDIWPYPGTSYLNVAQRLPFVDSSVELIKCEHMIEHIDYEISRYFFSEAYRVLQNDGVFRISTPDLEKIIYLYSGQGEVGHTELIEHHRDYHNRPTESICNWFNDHMRLWGHQFIFDHKTLLDLLKKAGFTKIKEVKYGESEHPALQNVEIHDEGKEWMRWAYVVIFEAYK